MRALCDGPSKSVKSRGYYTVAVVVVLSLLALLTTRSGTVLTTNIVKTTADEVIAAEVFYAAEVALAEGMSWLEINEPTVTPQSATPVPSDPDVSPRRYYTTFWFEESFDYIRVYGRAVGIDGSSATVTRWLNRGNDVLAQTALSQPLGIGGTLVSVQGTPEINAIGGSGVIPEGFFSLKVSAGEIPGDYGNLNNSSNEPVEAGEWGVAEVDIWDSYFAVDRETLKSMATPKGQIRWFESGESLAESAGSISSPVILIFEECTRITGQKLIIGVVFIDDSAGCDLNGWSMDLKGSLGVKGDVRKLNSNTDFEAYYIDAEDSVMSVGNGANSSGLDSFEEDAFSRLLATPGTWTDMEVN